MSTEEKTLFEKAPDEILDFPWNWSVWFERYEPLGTIDTAVITVPTSVPDAALTEDQAATVDGTVVTMWLAGGTLGKEYRVSCEITTTGGRTARRTSTFEIRDR